METTHREHDPGTLGDFVGEVVDAAWALAEHATESAADLAARAVKDAGRVARSFEDLLETAAREGVELARDAMDAVRDAVERAEEGRRADAPEFDAGQRTRWHADEPRDDEHAA